MSANELAHDDGETINVFIEEGASFWRFWAESDVAKKWFGKNAFPNPFAIPSGRGPNVRRAIEAEEVHWAAEKENPISAAVQSSSLSPGVADRSKVKSLVPEIECGDWVDNAAALSIAAYWVVERREIRAGIDTLLSLRDRLSISVDPRDAALLEHVKRLLNRARSAAADPTQSLQRDDASWPRLFDCCAYSETFVSL